MADTAGQAVGLTHPQAASFLRRDVHNVTDFFVRKRVAGVLSESQLVRFITTPLLLPADGAEKDEDQRATAPPPVPTEAEAEAEAGTGPPVLTLEEEIAAEDVAFAGRWHAQCDCYGRHRRPVATLYFGCYGRHRRPSCTL